MQEEDEEMVTTHSQRLLPEAEKNATIGGMKDSESTPSTGSLRRPLRCCVRDFSGRPCTLSDDPHVWSGEGAGNDVLLLGLGPGNPRGLSFLGGASTVYWLEAPSIRATLMAQRQACDPVAAFPSHWQEVSIDEAVRLAAFCRRYFYRPGLRLAPDFWGTLLARLDAAACAGAMRRKEARVVLLPGSTAQLLYQEMFSAFLQCGVQPVPLPPGKATMPSAGGKKGQEFVMAWRHLLCQGRPLCLFSVNLRGLDADGRVFYLCRELGIPVAIWFVDNPWHVLAGVRLPWWREAHLFVTDARFVASLRAEGAREVFHLPLAVAPHMWRPDAAVRELVGSPVFVGRTSFPNRERFFAAARVPQSLEVAAERRLQNSSCPADAPHFFWWQEHLGGRLWPGHDVRRMGLGAERCALANRVRWLRAAGVGQPDGLRIVGDAAWKDLLPDAVVFPPVDYYTVLPQIYASAGAVLNITSLLLPCSLSQRHFDVWASGGLLFSDATQGLHIFPRELVEPMELQRPEDFLPRWHSLQTQPIEARTLRLAWREHLRRHHQYTHRVQRVLEIFGRA